MFLGIIDFGLAPAHPHTPEEEKKLFGCYHKRSLLYKMIRVRVFPRLVHCLKSWSCWKLPNRSWERSLLFVCRVSRGETMAMHVVPTVHRQNAATKMFKWDMDRASALALHFLLLLQQVMRSAVPAQKLATSFAHAAKFVDDLRLAASNKSMKLLRAQVSKKRSLSPSAYMASLQSFK